MIYFDAQKEIEFLVKSGQKERIQVGYDEVLKITEHKIRMGGLWKKIGRQFYRVTDQKTIYAFIGKLREGKRAHFIVQALMKNRGCSLAQFTTRQFDAIMNYDPDKFDAEDHAEYTKQMELRKLFGRAKARQGIRKYNDKRKTEADERRRRQQEIIKQNDEIMPDRAKQLRRDAGMK